MPLVKEPHFCQPPIWPWLYRLDTVWQCGRCKSHWKVDLVRPPRGYSWTRRKAWVPLSA